VEPDEPAATSSTQSAEWGSTVEEGAGAAEIPGQVPDFDDDQIQALLDRSEKAAAEEQEAEQQ
jgi:hypothetical protein